MKAEGVFPLGRPRVLAVLPRFIPSSILTIVKPLTALHRAGQIVADITLEAWVSYRKVERADVVVFSRNTEPICGYVLETALALKKPVIYHLDDNFFEIPSFYQNESHHRAPERLAQLERYLKAANLVRVYSEPLLQQAKQFNSYVLLADGPVDWNLLPLSSPLRDPKVVRIVYATSRILEDDLARLLMADLYRLLSAYHGRVELFFWGYHPSELQGHSSVHFLKFVHDYDRFFRKFARSGFDVGLAPLRNDLFHRSKSNNKFREYAACRIAGIYSNVDVYSACVEDGQTGLLVSNAPGVWFQALTRLIEDARLRAKIQEQALQYAREHYSLEKAQAAWFDDIQGVITNTRNSSSMKQHPITHQDSTLSLYYRSSNVAGRTKLLLSSLLYVSQRAVQLVVSSIKTRGIAATINRVHWFLNDLRGLLRVKWNLSFISHCLPWHRSPNSAPPSPPTQSG